MKTRTRGKLKCPHCGLVYARKRGIWLVPRHKYAGRRCEGSGQVPRNPESDKRPLWKDEVAK